MLDVVSVERVAVASITDRDAQRAGFESREQLVAYVAKKSRRELGPDAEIYRVALAYGGPLEDTSKAREADLSDDDVAEIAQRLERLDRWSRHGPWTARTLKLIASPDDRDDRGKVDRPGAKAPPRSTSLACPPAANRVCGSPSRSSSAS